MILLLKQQKTKTLNTCCLEKHIWHTFHLHINGITYSDVSRFEFITQKSGDHVLERTRYFLQLSVCVSCRSMFNWIEASKHGLDAIVHTVVLNQIRLTFKSSPRIIGNVFSLTG